MKYILLLSLFFVSSFSCSEETTKKTEAQTLYEQGMKHIKGWFAGPAHFRKAFPLLEQSAKLGHAEAQVSLGYYYIIGYVAESFREVYNNKKSILNDPGRAEDVRQAKHWLEKAAQQGDAKMQFRVGKIMYNDLYYAREKNLEDKNRALYWLQKSADQGYRRAIAKITSIRLGG